MYNPVRRNRNIGTSKRGHGQNNRLCIPDTWHDTHIFYERLQSSIVVTRDIHAKAITFLVEPTATGYTHACTIDDIGQLAQYIPKEEISMIDLVVLRQPKRKETLLENVWGRLAFHYETKRIAGIAIILEAQQVHRPLKWSRSLSPERQQEFERLVADGHQIIHDKRHITMMMTIESCRMTQLFRTIPHEIGHCLDYKTTNNERRYHAKPHREKEVFAHRYADTLRTSLEHEKKIPFDRIVNPDSMADDGIKMEWFVEDNSVKT